MSIVNRLSSLISSGTRTTGRAGARGGRAAGRGGRTPARGGRGAGRGGAPKASAGSSFVRSLLRRR